MTNRIKTFWLEPTGRHKVWLNRANWDTKCSAHDGLSCTAKALIGDVAESPKNWQDLIGVDKTDPRWPTKCACGYEFKPEDDYFVNSKEYYKRGDTGEELLLEDAPVGATWHARGYVGNEFSGPDGLAVHCKTPGGVWNIDSRANNCTSPCKHCNVSYSHHDPKTCTNPGDGKSQYTVGAYEDGVPDHKCWIRHGAPSEAMLTVDKQGVTCQAGAGSILCGKYHGFLRCGYLEEC